MNISSINPQLIPMEVGLNQQVAPESAASPSSETFSQFLNRSINEVNDMLGAADKSARDLAVGKTENLHDAMITMEKAETAFKLLVQVRNKVIDAYQEVMRMQV